MSNFSPTSLKADVDNAWDPLEKTIEDFYSGAVLDFTSSSDKSDLESVADPSTGTCTSAAYDADSWIPTVQTPNEVSCYVSGNEATSTECPDITNSGGSCNGCLDSQSILESIITGGGTISTDIDTRYGSGAGCSVFAGYLQNAWNNYYSIKKVQYVDNGINSRTVLANTDVDSYKTEIDNIGTAFDSALTGM